MKKITLLLLLTLAPALFAADLTGRFDAGTPYEEPAVHAPANVSRMFTKSVTEPSSIDLYATGGSGMIIWTIAEKPVATKLRTPTGAELLPFEGGPTCRRVQRSGTQLVIVHPASPGAGPVGSVSLQRIQ